jgi:hypothetical protein
MMNSRQWAVLVIGVVIFILMALFPPVNRVQTLKIVNSSGEVEDVQESKAEFAGYRYYSSLQNRPDGEEFRVHKLIFGAQVLCLLVVIRCMLVSLRSSNAAISQGKLFHQPKNLPSN